MKRKVTIALITVTVGYLLICVALFFLQEYMLFPGIVRPRARDLEVPAGVRIDRLQLADGTSYRVAIAEPDKPRGVLAFFVGNGEDLRSGVRWAAEFAGYGLKTIVTEYPGYGESEGAAGYTSIIAAAETSTRQAKAWADAAELPLFLAGHSLGTFSAVHVAAQGIGQRLLLAAPPTSIAATGQRHYPFLPVSWLLRHPFDNLGKAGRISIPTLIIHGDADTIVPLAMGRRLAREIKGARLIEARGAQHNSLYLYQGGPFSAEIERHFFE